ncbi:MAG: hypothetical protein QXK71_07395 [Pyrobaculum sp.]
MYIELFVVAGQGADLENSLKKAVEEIRGRVQRPDRVRLATVKIRPEAVDQLFRFVEEPLEKVPPHYRSLVNMLKKYNVSKLPAVVIDGVKVGEGEVDLTNVLSIIQEKARSEFPELSSIELVPSVATPSPPQPVAPIQPEARPLPEATPEPPRRPPEVMPLEPPKPIVEAPEPQRPPEVIPPPKPRVVETRFEQRPVEQLYKPIVAPVKLVLGRPDNCGECAYFGNLTSRCFLFGFAVSSPTSPPCKQYVRGGG